MSRRLRYLEDGPYSPLPPSPITLLSLAEMVARIESIRLEEAPARCPTCGSTVRPQIKRCSRCRALKPLDDFHRERRRSDGRQAFCKACVHRHNVGPRRIRRIVQSARLRRSA